MNEDEVIHTNVWDFPPLHKYRTSQIIGFSSMVGDCHLSDQIAEGAELDREIFQMAGARLESYRGGLFATVTDFKGVTCEVSLCLIINH